ncbi:GreA/GreB family elongation factor [Gordonia paraffinivorans]|uniref:GreA/GreB family elongation factor n=1 Tax=Gordonia paraffinivorans TaxID=175628 RepID=UPI0010411F2B|nr:GreA/GreB family elongation factor [Gordonia paraffinivorans]
MEQPRSLLRELRDRVAETLKTSIRERAADSPDSGRRQTKKPKSRRATANTDHVPGTDLSVEEASAAGGDAVDSADATQSATVTSPGDATPVWFDRELEQYDIAAEELAKQEKELLEKLAECRDGGDLLADYRRYEQRLRQVKERQRGLIIGREQYIVDRDKLAAWGPTDDWVVAGSIVTVRYLDGHRDTFVLTERHTDTEYETISYDSPMGQAVRRRRAGDKVHLPAGASLVVESVEPGFRMPPLAEGQRHPSGRPPRQTGGARQVPTAANAAEALSLQRCKDKAYRDDLYRRRYEPQVRSINEYVDRLRTERKTLIPYVAPTYGGVKARLLTLMQDPGPKTDLGKTDGSGMICLENADLTAARQKFFLKEAGIAVSDIVSWNAYPWPKPHPQTTDTDRRAALALRDFLALTPDIEVVILNGVVAKRIWGLLAGEIAPRSVAGIRSIPTFHTSERAINPDQKSAEYIDRVHKDLSAKYATAARLLYGYSE